MECAGNTPDPARTGPDASTRVLNLVQLLQFVETHNVRARVVDFDLAKKNFNETQAEISKSFCRSL